MATVGTRVKATDDGPEGYFNNLVITNNATNPNTEIDITADVARLSSSDTPPKNILFRNISVTVNIEATASDGVSGLDTGLEVNNKQYALWLSGKSDGSTKIGELSENFSSPTTPTDYDYTLLVGAVRNGTNDTNLDPQGQGDFNRFRQVGNVVQCNDSYRILNSIELTTTNWTTIDLADVLGTSEEIVPISICDLVEITAVIKHDTNGTSLWFSGDPNRVNAAGGIYSGEVDVNTQTSIVKTLVPIDDSSIYYRAGAIVTNAPDATFYVTGYHLII